MDREEMVRLLSGGDLRSLGKSRLVRRRIAGQNDFNTLFALLSYPDRLVAMRAADIAEKISAENPSWLAGHEDEVLSLAATTNDKELLWHLVQIIPRFELKERRLDQGWELLKNLLEGKTSSRIVKVNALQGLYDLSVENPQLGSSFSKLCHSAKNQGIPSLDARIRKIQQPSNILYAKG